MLTFPLTLPSPNFTILSSVQIKPELQLRQATLQIMNPGIHSGTRRYPQLCRVITASLGEENIKCTPGIPRLVGELRNGSVVAA